MHHPACRLRSLYALRLLRAPQGRGAVGFEWRGAFRHAGVAFRHGRGSFRVDDILKMEEDADGPAKAAKRTMQRTEVESNEIFKTEPKD